MHVDGGRAVSGCWYGEVGQKGSATDEAGLCDVGVGLLDVLQRYQS